MTNDMLKIQSCIYILQDAIRESVETNEIFYAENPDLLSGLQDAARIVFGSAKIVPDLYTALAMVRHHGHNALTESALVKIDAALSLIHQLRVQDGPDITHQQLEMLTLEASWSDQADRQAADIGNAE